MLQINKVHYAPSLFLRQTQNINGKHLNGKYIEKHMVCTKQPHFCRNILSTKQYLIYIYFSLYLFFFGKFVNLSILNIKTYIPPTVAHTLACVFRILLCLCPPLLSTFTLN